MNQCARCGTTTGGGQLFRFYFGVVVDEPEAGPVFQTRGTEEVYFCDRCLIQAAAREEKVRTGFFLALGLFATLVAVVLVLASDRGLWACLVLLSLIAALGGAAYQRYRHLQAALSGEDPAKLRQAVCSNPKVQNMGDEWAIAHRRQALQGPGAELFLTRRENEVWSQPCQ